MSSYFKQTSRSMRPSSFEDLEEAYLIEKILTTNSYCWKMDLTERDLLKWLGNFKGELFSTEEERKIALFLLAHFVIYNFEEFKYLCKEAFSNYIRKVANINEIDSNNVVDIIKRTRFLPLGNPSESSMSMMYYFRTENYLQTACFEYIGDNFSRKYTNTNLVFIDDITSSGQQFLEYYGKLEKTGDIDIASCEIFVIFLVANKSAEERIKEKYPYINVIRVVDIDERSSGVSESSYIYHNDAEMNQKCISFMRHYGTKLEINNQDPNNIVVALGYGDKAQMFGFYYNIPDNVCPIFWEKSDLWYGIFKRNKKSLKKEIGGDYFDNYIKFI